MQPSDIQWTDLTNNPFRARLAGSTSTKGGYASGVGHYCEKVSPGCKHCYSSAMQPRFGLPEFQEQRRAGVEWFIDVDKLTAPIRRRVPSKIFWCDMTDMFGAWVPNEWIAACFGVMAATPQHTHQILTKRAERLPAWFEWLGREQEGGWPLHVQELKRHLKAVAGIDAKGPRIDWPLPNVHLGVSCENQETADERIPQLLATPAEVRWVSAEPLLGPIDFGKKGFGQGSDCPECGWMVRVDEDGCCASCGASAMWYGLDWAVVGGESGRKARPFDLAWGRSIVEQCRAANRPVFVKQMGRRPIADRVPYVLKDGHGGDPSEWPEDLRVREWPRVAEVR